MNPAFVILSVLFSTAVIMTVAMTLAWLHFGRERHVLIWAVSFGLSVVQWIFNTAGILWKQPALVGVAGLCILASSALVAIGARLRSGRPAYAARFALAAAIAAVGVVYAYSPLGSLSLRGSIATGFGGLMLGSAAYAMIPQGRRFTAPEAAFFTTLLLFTLYQSGLFTAAMFVRPDGTGLETYRAVLGLGLPAIYAAMCVAAVLVVAGDLAAQLGAMVSHDQLTGIFNRRGTEEAAAKAIANARRHRRNLAAVICDMDSFKALNDNYGHIAGDTALRAFAGTLKSAVRTGDVVGRLGGDEFCVLLLDSSGEAAAEVMERVRLGLGQLELGPVPEGGLSASFGVSELEAGDLTLDDLIVRADSALYTSKQNGRDRVTVWSEAA